MSDARNGLYSRVLERLQWHADVAAIPPDENWELWFSCLRPDNFRCDVMLSGRFARGLRGRTLDDLVRLVKLFCLAYPLDSQVSPAVDPDFPATILVPTANAGNLQHEWRTA